MFIDENDYRLMVTRLDKIDQLEQQVGLLRAEIAKLTAAVSMENTRPMKARDIEDYYGLPRSSSYSYNRIYLPDFGMSEGIEAKKNVWTRKEVFEWNSIPMKERARKLRTL